MKDESRAKWPDEMVAVEDKNIFHVDGFEKWIISDKSHHVVNPIYDRCGIAEARAKQICALPEMVALLKEAALIKEGDDYLSIVDKAKHILAQIGEGE